MSIEIPPLKILDGILEKVIFSFFEHTDHNIYLKVFTCTMSEERSMLSVSPILLFSSNLKIVIIIMVSTDQLFVKFHQDVR